MNNKLKNLKVGDFVKVDPDLLDAATINYFNDRLIRIKDFEFEVVSYSPDSVYVELRHIRQSGNSHYIMAKSSCITNFRKSPAFKREELIKYNSKSRNVEIDLKGLKLSNRQAFVFNSFMKDSDVENAVNYLNSLIGFRKRLYLDLSSIKDNSRDVLAQRTKNWFFNQLNASFDINASKDKKPCQLLKGEYIGVEVECLIPSDVSIESIRDLIIEAKLKGITATSDGSIHADNEDDLDDESEYYGKEFRILTKVNDLSNLEGLLKILKDVGAYVNRSCGLHVHLDCRDVTKATALTRARRLVKALPYLQAMVPSSRRNNHFCEYGMSKGGERYYMVNTTSLQRHGTIEVRLHSGTTDFKKISNWIKILFAASRTNTRGAFTDLNQFATKLNLTDDLKTYMIERIKAFNKPEVIGALLGQSFVTSAETSNTELSELAA